MPTPTTSKASSEVAAIINKRLLSFADLQRSVKNFLPPLESNAKTNNGVDEANYESEDDFVPENELAGLGVPPPSTTGDGKSTSTTQSVSSDDKLRKQLLGKRAREPSFRDRPQTQHDGLNVSKPRPTTTTARTRTSEDDEDEGRSGLGGTRRAGPVSKTPELNVNDQLDGEVISRLKTMQSETQLHEASAGVAASRKRPASYLDELLAERAAKKKRKTKKKKTSEVPLG